MSAANTEGRRGDGAKRRLGDRLERNGMRPGVRSLGGAQITEGGSAVGG